MVHREGSTGDTVQLNMLHGNHYQAGGSDNFLPGKTWGPWLWYLVCFRNSLPIVGSRLICFLRTMVRPAMQKRLRSRKQRLGHIPGFKTFPAIIHVEVFLVPLSFPMGVQHPVQPSFSAKIIQIKRPWIKELRTITGPMQMTQGLSRYPTSERAYMHSTHGRMGER